MRLRLIRHATLVLEFAGRQLLVDPMLAPAGALPAIEGTPNERPNPLVELPSAVDELLGGLDGVFVTHLHFDHFDDDAAAQLPRELPVLCQPPDEGNFKSREGFDAVLPVVDELVWEGIAITRTGGRHGSGALADALAPVSGFVLAAPGEPTLYLAGDTVWCDDVETALDRHHPDVVVLNAGGARFLEGEPITMGVADVLAVSQHASHAQIVAVHMEAINHCVLTRRELREAADAAGLGERLVVPADGETLTL